MRVPANIIFSAVRVRGTEFRRARYASYNFISCIRVVRGGAHCVLGLTLFHTPGVLLKFCQTSDPIHLARTTVLNNCLNNKKYDIVRYTVSTYPYNVRISDYGCRYRGSPSNTQQRSQTNPVHKNKIQNGQEISKCLTRYVARRDARVAVTKSRDWSEFNFAKTSTFTGIQMIYVRGDRTDGGRKWRGGR